MAIANATLQLVIVDDATVDRRGVWSFLDREPGIDVQAQVTTAEEAIGLSVAPRVILVGLVRCDESDMAVITTLKTRFPAAKVLVLAHTVDLPTVSTMIAAGVDGYVSKSAAVSEILYAIRAVARGDQYLDPRIGITLAAERHQDRADTALDGLTSNEIEVLRDVALGYTTADIARRVGFSVRTIENYRAHVQRTLDAHSRVELVRVALDAGLITSTNKPQ